ncbi:PREDICTED: phosphatase and actin regulator 4 [Tinamus guttatus]|uniref:phosphatase and actin regulator 4 n=1 Tax=Tinamus guttatus TaxID=94827 RepID=UPI00052F046A|nr:PREDICTED: phosphatase and actin regulator 4 [Tinamus guttatus]
MEDNVAEDADPAPPDAGMGVDVLESGDTTPPTKRKSKFSSFGKIFKPWKWRKKKSSDKFKETSEVLERKISMRKPREELVKRGVLLEDPEQDGEETEKLNPPALKNGHTVPIGGSGVCAWSSQEEEAARPPSAGKPHDEEEEDDDQEEEQQSSGPRVYIGDVPSVTVIPKLVPQVLPEEHESDEGMSDSDSEGPILYKDDEDEEEDESHNSTLANKVKRKDTLAMKLGNPAAPHEEKIVFPRKSKEEWNEIRHQIGTTLIRRLSQRPTAEELEQRNILQPKNEADRQAEKREIKRRLTRKLSQRPTVAELQARKILRFNEYVEVTDAQDYDRRADKPWTKLTPADKAAIRKELNEFKSCEMEVHEDSKQFTRYHRP